MCRACRIRLPQKRLSRTRSRHQSTERCAVGTRVEGKVAFITGAARGQGRSHAVRLAEGGADIIAVDVCAPTAANTEIPPSTTDDLAETADLVKQLNRRIVTAEVDVRHFDALK